MRACITFGQWRERGIKSACQAICWINQISRGLRSLVGVNDAYAAQPNPHTARSVLVYTTRSKIFIARLIYISPTNEINWFEFSAGSESFVLSSFEFMDFIRLLVLAAFVMAMLFSTVASEDAKEAFVDSVIVQTAVLRVFRRNETSS